MNEPPVQLSYFGASIYKIYLPTLLGQMINHFSGIVNHVR